jgi:hypothetical protein
MPKELTIPETPWTKEMLNSLSPEQRKRYLRELLIGILRENPGGITLSQLKEKLEYDERTIGKHLEYLVAIRESYKEKWGHFILYYPNGKILHDKSNENVTIGNKIYSFFMISNGNENDFYIQEKSLDDLKRTSVTGGLIIPESHIQEFQINFNEFVRRSKNVETNRASKA